MCLKTVSILICVYFIVNALNILSICFLMTEPGRGGKIHLRAKANRPLRTSKTGITILSLYNLVSHPSLFMTFSYPGNIYFIRHRCHKNWAQVSPLRPVSTVSPTYKQATPLHTIRLSYTKPQTSTTSGLWGSNSVYVHSQKITHPSSKEECPM